MKKRCGAELHYENYAGMILVFRMVGRKKLYRFRCPVCGHSGENNGRVKTCTNRT